MNLWEHRPFWLGGDFDLPSDSEEATYDLVWHTVGAASIHLAHRMGLHSGFGALSFINTAGGQALNLYRPGQVTYHAKHIVQRGSSMTLLEGAWFHRYRALRALGSVARFAGPIGTAIWIGTELYEARDDPIRHPHTTQLKYGISQQGY